MFPRRNGRRRCEEGLTMLHKVSDLSGPMLDAAVASIDGLDVVYRNGQPAFEHEWDPDLHCHEDDLHGEFKAWVYFKPSSCWADGGPIIERERIALYPPLCVGDWEEWSATVGGKSDGAKGPTPLIAAMRAFVASRFGETVELP
jgi:hypothetical protein